MKARHTQTGKEITILGISTEWGTATYIEDGILHQENLSGGWEIIDDSAPIDWPFFRTAAAKDILASLIEKASDIYELESLDKEVWCEQAVQWAKTLIEKLKQNNK